MSLLSSSRLLLACLLVFLLSLSPSLGQSILQNYATTYPSLQNPSSLAVSSDALYIADTSNARVVRMSINGSVEFVYTSQTSTYWVPRGIAIDGSGNIYIATALGSQVLEVGPTNTVLVYYNVTNPSLINPQGVAVDCSGRVYIADTQNLRIVRVDPAADYAFTVFYQSIYALYDVAVTSTGAVVVALYIGQVLKLSSEGEVLMVWNTTDPSLFRIQGVCVDSSDNIYIADTGNSRVVQMSATNNTIMAIYTTTNPTLSGPKGVAVDSKGVVYIADSGNNRVISMQGLVPLPTNGRSTGCPLPSNSASTAGARDVVSLYLILAIVWIAMVEC
jgi:streptogramin lyase